ncbi:kinesin-like protein KIN-14Q isoform X1 [Selaginella moellendorffii]|uniref:kinesin-like protein KIN-14Q isoform X1 n=2 Tax=Selaginella moellendorffii TaxID=88036 RepID=UPI000D1C3CDF|nr:kinesin-like protein KIN-14Q isoform X1 [Selaginella moellendorffii]XP_024531179.1 kinesin-like protein KIN-14Q isoform X1 [Selaginella moellendorffii]|eukprot:XP_024531178.1 kinesin-like protein KIN-14Q isoform X1 [Selaginella moellendorffii]
MFPAMAPERRLFGGASPRSGNVVSEREISRQQSRDFFVEDPMEEGLSDIHMASRRAEEAAHRRFLAARWLHEMLGGLGISNEPSEEELKFSLRNGMVLCNLLNKIHPGIIPKIVESPPPSSPPDAALSAYQYFENVRNFLVAVEDLRLPSFEASDLAEGSLSSGTLSKVVDCILALKAYHDQREGKGFSPWKYGVHKLSGTKSPVKGLEDMYEPAITPKSSHTRKRWAIPGADVPEATDISVAYEAGSPIGHRDRSPSLNGFYQGYDTGLDSENLMSAFASPDSTAARLQQIGQRFREVLQVKRVQDIQASDLDTNPNLKGQPVQSLPSLVKSIISDKQPDEVPVLVEYMIKKVTDEFERRLRLQGEQVKKLKSLHKDLMARECKLSSRAKVLEALAAGSGEEIKLVTQQLQQTKMENKRLEEEKRIHESDTEKLVLDRDQKQTTIEILTNELQVMKADQRKKYEMEIENEKLMEEYKRKLSEMDAKLEDSFSQMRSFEASVSLERNEFKNREDRYKQIISFQSNALQNLKHTSGLIRTGTLEMQKCWQDQLIRLENELTGLTEAAQAYHDVLAENRKLYNEVQDLKGNIRVYCRVRPFLVGQKDQGTCVDFVGQNGEIMVANSTKGKDSYKMFNFNKVYGPQAPQDEVFLDAQPLIRSVLDGFNVCIFAYGQTGSGKTYTMTGPSSTAKQDWGVNYRALNDLFQLCQSRRDAFAYEVGVQMIEIYNEQVRDLLAADGVSKRLGIRSSSSLNGVHVPDAVMIPVANSSDVLEIMAVGQRNRAVGATALNERSSRSHSVLTVHVQGTDLAKGCILRGCLHLVDLAGSERVEKSEATGDRLKEAQHINKSLSALGDVIAALAQKQTHIPYRNSKLTQLLQHSLGGQAKALMFVHINPDNDSYGETISTLKFAERVSSVELGAARSNREASGIREYKEQIMSLKEILAKKDAEIERLQASRVLRSSMEVEKQKLRVSQSTRSIDARSRRSVELRSMEAGRAPSQDETAAEDIPDVTLPETPRRSVDGDAFVVFENNVPGDWPAMENNYEDLSEGEASQDSFTVASDQSQTMRAATNSSRPGLNANELRSLSQIPRPPRSEKKLPSAVSMAGLRRLSDIPLAAVASEELAKRGSKPSSIRQSGILIQNGAGVGKLSKRLVEVPPGLGRLEEAQPR